MSQPIRRSHPSSTEEVEKEKNPFQPSASSFLQNSSQPKRAKSRETVTKESGDNLGLHDLIKKEMEMMQGIQDDLREVKCSQLKTEDSLTFLL